MINLGVDPLTHVADAQTALERAAQALRQSGAVDRAQELRHAEIYAASAALFRRRAANRQDPEQQATLEARAAWYEGRARIKREGKDMPRELRTPSESLETVDRMRRTVAELCARFADVSVNEMASFAEACEHAHPDAKWEELSNAIAHINVLVWNLGVRLGEGGQIYLGDYRKPTIDAGVEAAIE